MKRILFLFVCMLSVMSSIAQTEVYHSTAPDFTIYVPQAGGDGRAVVLCPGGGYAHIAGSHEGKSWVPFFTQQGIAVVVTKYTIPDGDKDKPLNDIRNTFKYLHEHGKEWGINPNGIGIMGFSAGGHLASAYTNSERGDLRPAFEILFYPVIRLDNKEHLGMAKKFLGSDVSDELRKEWSTNRMVTSQTPKTIIFTADDDPTIAPTNSTTYYEALKKNHVQATLHIYPQGGHGFGFRSSFPYHEQMKAALTDWLKSVKVPASDAVRVACIGNSITYGARLKYRDTESWPAQLQELSGSQYWVKNFGVSGATMADTKSAYMKTPEYQFAKDFLPNIVFIKLGTNDIHPRYAETEEMFLTAYQQMIDELKSLPSHPKIVLCLPATSYRTEGHLDADITSKIIPMVKKTAKKNKLDVINLHTPTAGHADLFPDKLHPNPEGERIIAETIFGYLK